MQTAALLTKAIDRAVTISSAVTFDNDNDDEAALAGNLQTVNSSALIAGNVVVVPTYRDLPADPPSMNISNLHPPQILMVVVLASTQAIILEVVMNLFDEQNPQPAHLATFGFALNPANAGPAATRGIGSRHRIKHNILIISVSSMGIFFAAAALRTPRTLALFPDGLVGVPMPVVARFAPPAGPQQAAVENGDVAGTAPAAPVHHATSREQDIMHSRMPMMRFLRREAGPLKTGQPTPGEFLDRLSGGPSGRTDGQQTYLAVRALAGSATSGIVTENRLYLSSASNVALVLEFNFGTEDPIIVTTFKGTVMSHLTSDSFAKAQNGKITFARSLPQRLARITEWVMMLKCICEPALLDGGVSLDALFAPLVQILQGQQPPYRPLAEPWINQEILGWEVDGALFKFSQLIHDPRSSAPGFSWFMFEAATHAIWNSISVDSVRTQSLLAVNKVSSAFGKRLRDAQSPAAAGQQAALGPKKAKQQVAKAQVPLQQGQAPLTNPAPAPMGVAAAGRLSCAYYLAHRLGVVDARGQVIRDCIRPNCLFVHRDKPAALSTADKQLWVTYYSGGSLPFTGALVAAINALP